MYYHGMKILDKISVSFSFDLISVNSFYYRGNTLSVTYSPMEMWNGTK